MNWLTPELVREYQLLVLEEDGQVLTEDEARKQAEAEVKFLDIFIKDKETIDN